MPDFVPNPNSLDSILTRMEARQVGNTEKLEKILNKIDQHEERIERLETFKWWLLGAVGAGSAGGGVALSKILGGE